MVRFSREEENQRGFDFHWMQMKYTGTGEIIVSVMLVDLRAWAKSESPPHPPTCSENHGKANGSLHWLLQHRKAGGKGLVRSWLYWWCDGTMVVVVLGVCMWFHHGGDFFVWMNHNDCIVYWLIIDIGGDGFKDGSYIVMPRVMTR